MMPPVPPPRHPLLLVAGAAVCFAVMAVSARLAAKAIYGSFSVVGLLATAPFGLSGFRPPSPAVWLLLIVIGLTSVAGQLLMTFAYRWVTNLQAGVMLQLSVVLSLVVGSVLLGEHLSPLQLLGSALTIGGVLGVVRLSAPMRA